MFQRIKLIFVIVFIWQTPLTESTFWTNRRWSTASIVELFRFLQESIMVDRLESARTREEVKFICKNRWEWRKSDNGKLTDFNSCRKFKTTLSLPSSVSAAATVGANATTTDAVQGRNATNNKWLDTIPSLPLKFFIHGWKDYGANNWVEQLQDGKNEISALYSFLKRISYVDGMVVGWSVC